MKIKLISLILILCCFISVSGYGQTEGYTNEEETKQYEQEKTFLAKTKEAAQKTVKECQNWIVLGIMFSCWLYQFRNWLNQPPYNAFHQIQGNGMQWQQLHNQRTSAQMADMAW
ncbi:hypothetical protein [Candidatus Endomicrobiellum devescovinae]|jgi:hypothetical protein|uniref:hypothetical protein n=1 Tax=Candidatus Endomicrobiellum devescovinae TaxID=3242322 RepID=UPI00281C5FCB|nr:hypothetical protein [Endomicrobium sp.]